MPKDRCFFFVRIGKRGQPLERYIPTYCEPFRKAVERAIQMSQQQGVGVSVWQKKFPRANSRERIVIPHPQATRRERNALGRRGPRKK